MGVNHVGCLSDVSTVVDFELKEKAREMEVGESADLISILGLPTRPKADTCFKKTPGSDIAAQVIFNDLSGAAKEKLTYAKVSRSCKESVEREGADMQGVKEENSLSVINLGDSLVNNDLMQQQTSTTYNAGTDFNDGEVEDVEPLQCQDLLLEKEMDATIWVHQNLIKLGKIFGVDFLGHEEEALELLKQIDSCRQARMMEADSESRKPRFRGIQELKGLSSFNLNFKSNGKRNKGKGETKLEGEIKELVNQTWGRRWVRFECLEASGTRGGILMLWDSRVWKGEVPQIGAYTVTCRFEALLQSFECHITGVYAPNCYIERRAVWREIGGVRGLMEGPWAVCGDFNVTRYASEKRNCNRRTRAMLEISDFIEGDNQVPASRIDRILLSEECDASFRNIKQTLLQRLESDHVPVSLQCGSWEQTKSYFKFDNWWLSTEGFVDMIREWWSSFEFSGKPDYILACKLKALKGKLKEWSRSSQGNLALQKTNLLSQIAAFDSIQDIRALTEDESVKKTSLLMEYEEHIKNEEIAWRQRSRALWLKEGDRNTKFFHITANAHKRSNNIDQLVTHGETIEEPDGIKSEIIDFYKRLYTEAEGWRPAINFDNCLVISEEEKEFLQGSFEEQEVLDCLKICAVDKAPGPDGYIMGFFVKCWDVLKHDIIATFRNFHSHGIFETSFNATYIALISKKTGAKKLRDFRPISLIGNVYKLFSKVLTERLKKVIEKLVDSQQMDFIKGRQIINVVLIANEAVDSRIKQKKPGILCKLDIKKAYDHVNWNFLLKMLDIMGFGEKWIKWIKYCISTVRFFILINGSPEGFFPAHRGLRQGGPLSPFLFILAMEGLNNMVKTARSQGWIKGFEEQLRFLRIILVLFEGISGLHINWRKSHLFPINKVPEMEHLALILGGEVGSLPAIYLGMPLGAKSKSKLIWNSVIEKCEKKLARWKSQYLSLGGRLTLINSDLDSLPTYMMSLFPIPAGVTERLDRLRRSFLWQGNKEKKVVHLVKWKSLTIGKTHGGLGIRNLKNQNKALKMK
uniref:Uncharacterized protein LOC104249929 n=1 Tax=Nicotiana sylvestris TaxID=4096 RepID=A0A1U7YS36_NICSY|nr:PREDICTED: uncharacterized protein LOC104249929 [Nicotiana sylvestris]